MNTPIADFLDSYSDSNAVRLHMPGHKGAKSFDRSDITEIFGADSLYEANGIIGESEKNAALLFGTAATCYSTEGSSHCIRAMIYLAGVYAEENKLPRRILAARNAHKSFVTAAALTGFDVDWILPQNGGVLSGEISSLELDKALTAQKYAAVYITSPDYLGGMADISAISAVCKKHGVLLAVDNAHGAYLKFTRDDMHPVTLGADICCDSAHKTLPVLTGGAYLHIAKHGLFDKPGIKKLCKSALAIFGSTSPSYLIMRSLDEANKALSDGYAEKIAAYAEYIKEVKTQIKNIGFELYGAEPMKITIAPKPYGIDGYGLDAIMRRTNIFCDFAESDHIVFMPSPNNAKSDTQWLLEALKSVPRGEPLNTRPPELILPKKALSLREALFAPHETVKVAESIGRICADPSVSCPPAVPFSVCGEIIDINTAAMFKYYGIKYCSVIK